MSFNYIIDKIKAAEFVTAPFKHIYIEDLFSPGDFELIARSSEINLPACDSDEELFEALFASGYKIIDFPGCITEKDQYVRWHKQRRVDRQTNSACEGFGMTLRLMTPTSPAISSLHEFLVGDKFRTAIAGKFQLPLDQVRPDSGIQKYLDGYEISPHADIRKKALTYMVNINPHEDSEQLDHHTHYLTFKPAHKYVQAFWEGNPKVDRAWVPWDWCETQTRQVKNNSLVLFAPDNDTVHAVKANYDHLKAQRTQLYGNLWYNHSPAEHSMDWEDLVLDPLVVRKSTPVNIVPEKVRSLARKVLASGVKSNKQNVVIRGV